MHGLNEGHIAPYTDIEFQLTKYITTYIRMKFQDKSLQLIFEETMTLLTKIKRVKQMALKQYFTTFNSTIITTIMGWNHLFYHTPKIIIIRVDQVYCSRAVSWLSIVAGQLRIVIQYAHIPRCQHSLSKSILMKFICRVLLPIFIWYTTYCIEVKICPQQTSDVFQRA